eukprot:6196104-Pleurochrysis_carterae.AAC.1
MAYLAINAAHGLYAASTPFCRRQAQGAGERWRKAPDSERASTRRRAKHGVRRRVVRRYAEGAEQNIT